jgi:hypothetical protein
MIKLGSQENPCRNNYEIDKIIKGMLNCKIYTLNTFEISEENLKQAKARNIIFIGLAVAYLKTPTITKATTDAVRKENISQIGINANTNLPINLDEIEKQITSQFGIGINLDEALNKTATQLQQEYNNQYLGRW